MLMGPQNLPERLAEVRDRMEKAALAAGRRVDSITLLGITKGQPAAALHAAARAGITDVGESYLQEALDKMTAVEQLRAQATPSSAGQLGSLGEPQLTWHFVGRLQSNKTRPVAERFAWVHAVDRLKIAQRLAEQRPYYAPPLNVCLQVNVAEVQGLWDEEAIQRIVTSLVTSARQHSPEGGGVFVEVQSGREGAMLSVRDEGPALRGEEAEQLFEPWKRGAAPPRADRRRQA